MKTLKTLDTEALNEIMPKIEETLEEHDAELAARIGGRVDCVAQCGSYVYAQFGYSGGNYSASSLQNYVDYRYGQMGSAAGQGVMTGDVNMFLTEWFVGTPRYISGNYQPTNEKPVIIVVKVQGIDGSIQGHAVVLKAVNKEDGTVYVWDAQNTCGNTYNISQIINGFEITGVNERPKQNN